MLIQNPSQNNLSPINRLFLAAKALCLVDVALAMPPRPKALSHKTSSLSESKIILRWVLVLNC